MKRLTLGCDFSDQNKLKEATTESGKCDGRINLYFMLKTFDQLVSACITFLF